MRTAIYLRLSQDTEASTSIDRQREACLDAARRKGWEVVAEISDVDVSGSKVAPWDRPGFSEILARDDVDVILAYRLDRVARSVSDFSLLLRRLEERRVAFASATEPFDLTEPLGKVLVYLVAIFAEMEADAIGVRVRSSIDRLRRTGRWSHGREPFGYRIVDNPDGPGRVLEIDPEEAAVVREIAERVLAGEGQAAIARDLNTRGIRPRVAKAWGSSSVRALVVSDHLLGRQRHRGELVRDDSGEPIPVWEPLLSLQTVERLRAAVDSRSRGKGRQIGASRVLSGLLSCASCGRTMTVSGSAREKTYRCPSRTTGALCDSPAGISAPKVERVVVSDFLTRFGDHEAVRRVTVSGKPAGLADLDSQISETLRLLGSAESDDEPRLLDLLRVLKGKRADAARDVKPRVETTPLGLTVREAWDAGAITDRRVLLSALLDKVTVARGPASAPDRIGIFWTNRAPE